ncbi:hypothetical protein EG832_15970 [bacterium]|nr:hypothetical protein [bacterium]
MTGYIAVQNIEAPEDKAFWSLVIGCLGLLFSVSWYCVNRGSKQWQENWENHVDLLEDEIIGPLYKVVTKLPEIRESWWSREGFKRRLESVVIGPGPFSVSKINQVVSLFVCLLWIVLVWKALPQFRITSIFAWDYFLILILTGVATGTVLRFGRTKVRDSKKIIAITRDTTVGD